MEIFYRASCRHLRARFQITNASWNTLNYLYTKTTILWESNSYNASRDTLTYLFTTNDNSLKIKYIANASWNTLSYLYTKDDNSLTNFVSLLHRVVYWQFVDPSAELVSSTAEAIGRVLKIKFKKPCQTCFLRVGVERKSATNPEKRLIMQLKRPGPNGTNGGTIIGCSAEPSDLQDCQLSYFWLHICRYIYERHPDFSGAEHTAMRTSPLVWEIINGEFLRPGNGFAL